jgi:hypothetical protein
VPIITIEDSSAYAHAEACDHVVTCILDPKDPDTPAVLSLAEAGAAAVLWGGGYAGGLVTTVCSASPAEGIITVTIGEPS